MLLEAAAELDLDLAGAGWSATPTPTSRRAAPPAAGRSSSSTRGRRIADASSGRRSTRASDLAQAVDIVARRDALSMLETISTKIFADGADLDRSSPRRDPRIEGSRRTRR